MDPLPYEKLLKNYFNKSSQNCQVYVKRYTSKFELDTYIKMTYDLSRDTESM